MASRNDRRKPPVTERDVKQVETGVNVFVKLACLAMLGYFVYVEASGQGPINVLAWAFLFGAFFGKEAIDKFMGGRR